MKFLRFLKKVFTTKQDPAPGKLDWASALQEVFVTTNTDPREAANICTELAKGKYATDPDSVLLLASLAATLDPKPWRQKWRGFKLAKAGRQAEALEQLQEVRQTSRFSRDEINFYTTLLDELLPAAQRRKVFPKLAEKPTAEVKVAAIMDEFTAQSYAPECNLLELLPDQWPDQLESFQPDLLLIESAWRGKDETWGNKIGHFSHEVRGIVNWCKFYDIPTAFWNKEDPVHFETFLNTALHFDFVFTTDLDCIERYKKALGHDRVYLLPFACQPRSHNPVEEFERKKSLSFAGAYYARYIDRSRDFEDIVDKMKEVLPIEIYDRNHGKDHPDYMFPEKYKEFILGSLPFSEIAKAYKGYQFALNMNSIKSSQTMFARRAFELLASNTIVVSNYSRGLKLMFGNLIQCGDSGEEHKKNFLERLSDEEAYRKTRLAGLRKVLAEHTYGDRFANILSKVGGVETVKSGPRVLVLGVAKQPSDLKHHLENLERQCYGEVSMVIYTKEGMEDATTMPHNASLRPLGTLGTQTWEDVLGGNVDKVAFFVPEDYYGPNYLTDLVLATKYTDAPIIGKRSFFHYKKGKSRATSPKYEYQYVASVHARRALASPGALETLGVAGTLEGLKSLRFTDGKIFSTDRYNYCFNAPADPKDESKVAEEVNDLDNLDLGVPMRQIQEIAETRQIAQTEPAPEPFKWNGAELASKFPPEWPDGLTPQIQMKEWSLRSTLPDGQHAYVYMKDFCTPEEFGWKDEVKIHLETSPGLNLRWVILFFNKSKERIGHVILGSNSNQNAPLMDGTAFLKFGLRIYSSGTTTIKNIYFGNRVPSPVQNIRPQQYLLITNHYPTPNDIYRNGFVHRRVKIYEENGCHVDVFRLRTGQASSWHDFEGVECMTGSKEQLRALLASGSYGKVLVHFLGPDMWDVLKDYVDKIKVVAWVHGAEVQPFHRREYNYTEKAKIEKAKVESEQRLALWGGVLDPMPQNLKLVFVSKYLAMVVMEDLGIKLGEGQYSIIHNPIDTNLFTYQPKPVSQRKKILSIRPFASRTYANDLSVQTVLALSKKPFFHELDFYFVGDGILFEETLEPLREFPNVRIHRGFLRQPEIAALHKEYGIFLVPTRMDTHGVSRDEAMASGLVPITNSVAAVPEFVDGECGFAVPAEDFHAMANAVEKLYESPKLFEQLSEQAYLRIQRQTQSSIIAESEMSLFLP